MALALEYLGGSINGDFTADFRKETPVYHVKGRIKKWRVGRLLGELGLRAPLSGTLYLSVDGHAYGKTTNTLVRSMNGYATVSLWGGRVPGRLVDLTGLNLVTWMFADDQSDSSKIVCTVVPLRFKNGRATGNKIIVETENVQIVGGGWINLPKSSFNLSFLPRPKAAAAHRHRFSLHRARDFQQSAAQARAGERGPRVCRGHQSSDQPDRTPVHAEQADQPETETLRVAYQLKTEVRLRLQ